VLASRSPQRLGLAQKEGWHVTVATPPEAAEADQPPQKKGESLEAYVLRLAHAKAIAVAATGITGTLVACDTLSQVDGVALGKPANRNEARSMLEMLSGKRHRVLSGVCVWQRPQLEPLLGFAESVLEMGPLSASLIEWYLASGLWHGKSGACGFQDERIPLTLVSGSPSNVIGLPLEKVRSMLVTVDEKLRQAAH